LTLASRWLAGLGAWTRGQELCLGVGVIAVVAGSFVIGRRLAGPADRAPLDSIP
jgi:hypothetical protein